MGNSPDANTEVGRLSAVGLRALLEANTPMTLLDVREPFERSYCAIAPMPSSVRDLLVPTREIRDRMVEIQALVADDPVVVYCHHGVRSMAVARWLLAQGFSTVLNLEGGIDAWSLQVDSSVPRY